MFGDSGFDLGQDRRTSPARGPLSDSFPASHVRISSQRMTIRSFFRGSSIN